MKNPDHVKKLLGAYKSMNRRLMRARSEPDPIKRAQHLKRARQAALVSDKYEKKTGIGMAAESRDLNEIKINDKMRERATKRANRRTDSAYFWNGVKWIAHSATGQNKKALEKFAVGYDRARKEHHKSDVLDRNMAKRQMTSNLKKYPPLHESGDRVYHEKYGMGSVIATRMGYVEVGFDGGYNHKFLEESVGKVLRKISGRGEGLTPTGKSAKRKLADKLDQSADDKYHSAYNVKHPYGLAKTIAKMNDVIYGSDHRDKYADMLSKHAGKQKNKAAEMRDTANRRSDKIKYTYDSNAKTSAERKKAKATVDEFEKAHRAVRTGETNKTRTISGYKALNANNQDHKSATHWKEHPKYPGRADFDHYFNVTPTNKGYHVRYHGHDR